MDKPIDITFAIEPQVSSLLGHLASRWELILLVPSQTMGWDPKTKCIIDALTAEQLIGFLPPDAERPKLSSVPDLLRYLSGHMQRGNGTPVLPLREELATFGAKLFDNSFAKHLHWNAVRELRDNGQALRFTLQWNQVRGSAGDAGQLIREIPWELLHDECDFLFQTVPSIHVVTQEPWQSMARVQNRRALILTVADSSDGPLTSLRVDGFSEKLRDLLLLSGYFPTFLPNASAARLKDALAADSFQLFFAICHGESAPADAGILKCANGSHLTGKELAAAIRTGQGDGAALELAVLAACWSGSSAPGPLSGMAQYLIHTKAAQFAAAFTTEVSATFALALTQNLFSWMRLGKPKEQAFHEARLSLKNSQEWWTARLFIGSKLPTSDRFASRALIPAPCRAFVGRRQEMDGLVDWLRRMEDPGLCVLSGPSGSGKTEVALQTIEQLWSQARDRPVVWVDMQRELLLDARPEASSKPSSQEILLDRLLRDLEKPQEASFSQPALAESETPTRVLEQLTKAISECQKQGTGGGKPMVIVIDGWPSGEPIPAVLCCRIWKVLVTTTRPMVRVSAAKQAGNLFTEMLNLELAPLRWEQAQKLLPAEQIEWLGDKKPSLWPLDLLLLRAVLSKRTLNKEPEWLQELVRSDSPLAIHRQITRTLLARLLPVLSGSERALLKDCFEGELPTQTGEAYIAKARELKGLAESGLIVYDELLMRCHVPDAIRDSLPSGWNATST